MPVGLSEPKDLLPVPGVRLASAYSGIKAKAATDTVLIELNESATVAGVFTKNAFCAAPVTVCKKHLEQGSPRALLINSGNANAGTGEPGMKAALTSCRIVAEALDVAEDAVLPFSTGVIGQLLPADKFADSMPGLVTALAEDSWLLAANAIRTTDTIAKAVSRQVHIDGKTVTITGMSKGAGMICPNMATMLCFIVTDININKTTLKKALVNSVDNSFNKIIVDGDTSTNDSVIILSNGALGNNEITLKSSHYNKFEKVLTELNTEIAELIVKDGEGATKVVKIDVQGARTVKEAEKIARCIGNSQLVKTAFFGQDPNWGRILAAAGRAGVVFNPDKVEMFFDDKRVIKNGTQFQAESKFASVFKKPKFTVTLKLKEGKL